MKNKLMTLVANHEVFMLAIFSVLWGVWVLFFIDFRLLSYWNILKESIQTQVEPNIPLYLLPVSYNVDMLTNRLILGIIPLLLGIIDIWAITTVRINVRKFIKSGLFVYWIFILSKTMANNVFSPIVPFLLLITFCYLILYIRLSDDRSC